jgi:hypothetical protein
MTERTTVGFDGSNLPEAKVMNRKQVLDFNAAGLNPLKNKSIMAMTKKGGETDPEAIVEYYTVNDDMTNWILDHVYSDYDFDGADWILCQKLAGETYNKTFRVGTVEVKNS